MIGRLQGILLQKDPPRVLVDVGGVGYDVDVPMSTLYDLPAIGASPSMTRARRAVADRDGPLT